jgi:CrcB protein
MQGALWVALGGALGSLARFGAVRGVAAVAGEQPWGTFAVNVLGSLAIGFLAAFFARKFTDHEAARVFLVTGFLGGFTTFSAFSLDTFNLMQRGENGTAALYVLLSVIVSLVATFAGYAVVARWLVA